ncbi:MAG: SdrD B-like domain-containing protein, partial [Verrucomicrobiota bacterium]
MALIALGTTPSWAANIIHEFYVPLPEVQVKTALVGIEPASGIVGNTLESVISIVATGAGSVLHYDHWEDGYEVDLNNPAQSTTEIWGDGNNANGVPPGYANDPATFATGSVIVLRNQVPLPRNPANRLYDGRDRFGGTKALVVSRASWATTPGTVLCGANEVLPTMDYGTQYIAPVGDDVSANSMFEYVGLFVMARDDATTVAIDADGAGAGAAINITLNRGESYVVNGGIKKGATVNSGKPVQVHLVTGDIGARYESRRFTLYPRDQWSDVTYSPVGTAANGHQAYAFIYNPNAAALTINVSTAVGAASFTVAANGVTQYQIPQNSGARFVSSSAADFFGVVTVGANPSSNNVHDWGFSMVPSDNLTTEAVVGWGPGSENLTQNGSPVWVTPTSASRVYVDYNGDKAGSLTDPKGNKYDAHLDIGTMESRRVNDPDKDQTAMRLYTLDGVTITAAWGQDPAVAGPALPYLDCGTTVLPFPVPTLIKSFTIAIDAGNPGLTIGDTIEYRIDVDNKGLLPLGNLLVLDPLNASLGYVAGSTKRDGVAIADATTGTAFPLDESGYTIPIILRGGMTTFTYRCTVNAAGSIANTVSNSNYNLVSTANVVVPPPAGSTPCGAQFTNAAGVVQTSYTAGSLIYATMTDPDANNTASVESITVVVKNTTNGDSEFVTLVETTATSGIFRNTTGLTTSTTTGSSQMDSTLLIAPGNSLSFIYTDPEFNETCTGSAVIAVPTLNKFLYLSDPSQALDRVDPVATSDATTASSATLGLGAGSITVVGAAASSNAGQTVSTHSFSYNSGSTGSNRILMVGISYRDGDDELVSSVTYGGQAMTSVGTQNVDDSTAPDGRIYIYRLYNPPLNANSLAVTWNSALDQGAVVGAITYAGVDITGTPLGTFASAAVLTGNPAVNVPSAAGDVIFGVVAGRNAANYTVTGGGTSLWAAFPYTGQTAGAAQSKTGVATQTNISFGSGTSGNALLAAIGGVALKAAPAGGTPTATFTQAPTFASTFTLPVGATPVVTAHYNVATGTMPTTPSITAVLKKNTTTFATSTGASASTSTGNGILTFNFNTLASATNFAANDYVTLDITTAQSGVTFTVRYDSSSMPSKITLPTTTVIDVNTLGVYDAPYPAGNLITGLTSGTTVYVRSAVSDPFGHADITSMGLAITGPGGSGNVSTTLNAANVVTNTTGTKTYEYAWAVGATTGTYNIAVTANEGTEGINATRATTVNVTMLDLGTPSTTHFTTGLNGPRTPVYAGGETVYVRVTDLDQNTNAAVAETVTVTITTASGDSELITLTETGVNTGIFVGSIPASTTLGAGTNNGTLRAVLGEVLNVTYVDPTDALDTSNDTATIPNVAPAVSVKKTLVMPADGIAVIGEALQYTVQVANTGNTTLSTIALTDTFPAANLAFVSASLTPSSTGSGTVSWTNVGPLTSGQSITITLNFTALTAGPTVTNTAAANAGGGVTGSSFANVTITRPAHTITKTLISPNPGPANIGGNVVFRISVQNTGTTAISTLPVEDLYSGADFSFVSATTAPDATGNGTLLWNDITGAGNLAVGAPAITIDVTLKAKGAAAPAINSASANYSVDVNGDPVPAVSSNATITLVAAKITGRVYIDPDQSGTFNAGDSAFGSITVSLYTDPNADGNPADGTLVAIATTANDGLYEFPNLATGTYVIVESQPAGYSSSGDTQGANDNRIALNVSTLTTFANNNFFDYLTPAVSYASISGKVWNDANASATVTAGEVGIENVPVDLIEDSNNNGVADPGEAVVSSTLTAADGTYSFPGLSAGNYVVVERDLFGWYSTADVTAPNNNMIPVTAAAGSNTTGRDFLDVLTGTVGGKVYHDVDGSGSFNAGDVALQNIDVIITNVFGVLQTVVTNATGDWTASVPPGTTNVNVDQADAQFTAVFTTGYQQTAGTDPNNVTAVTGVITPAGDDGFRRLGSITGTVLADTNNDNTGDVGINAVTLTLKDSSGNDVDSNPGLAGVQPTTTTTNVSGAYTFAGLVHGTYQVVETDLAGYFSVTTNTVTPVNVVAGSVTSGVNFVDEQAGSITGFVRADTDNNDTGDVGINAVTLTLKDSSGNDIDSNPGLAGIQATTTTTNASGVYTFGNLLPGTYQVVETDLAGYFSVTPNTVASVVVNAGAITSNINFVDEQAGSITGFVRADTDNNDTGDVGINAVTLTLKDSSGNDIDSNPGLAGVQPTTTTTNASGAYTFGSLLPGTYQVVETDLA